MCPCSGRRAAGSFAIQPCGLIVGKPVASQEMRILSQMAEDDMMVAANEL